MGSAESWTYWTARLAIGFWLAGFVCKRRSALSLHESTGSTLAIVAKSAFAVGLLLFLTHTYLAFEYFHHWSHREAFVATAERTAALTGWRWGGGIYFNYLFGITWCGDVAWQWMFPASFQQRPRALDVVIDGFMGFMCFNAAVVFAAGPMRWVALGAMLVASAAWIVPRRQRGIR